MPYVWSVTLPEGLAEALAEGINVNITLLFSLEGYEKVMEAYLKGLERRAEAGEPLERVASVASFFVSRVDSAVDKLLEERLAATDDEAKRERIRSLLGKAAIANAKLAYRRYQEIFGSDRFARLRERGAQVQRPLWASTSTKNPEYRDVVYVEELIGPDTVNTMPLATVEAFADHGVAERTVDRDVDEATLRVRKAHVAVRLGAVAAGHRDVELGIAPHAVLGDVEPGRLLHGNGGVNRGTHQAAVLVVRNRRIVGNQVLHEPRTRQRANH